MHGLRRDKKKFYLCKKEPEGRLFQAPVEKRMNYQAITSTGDVLAYGQEYTMFLTITTSPEKAKEFSNFDRCYVEVEPPQVHDKLCTEADYYVYGDPIITSNEGVIKLRKMSGDMYDKENARIEI